MESSELSRKKFISIAGLSATALTLGFYFSVDAQKPTIIKTEEADQGSISLNAWIHIDKNGKVTIVNHRAEMGQGSYQAIPQMIGEELEVNLNDINIVSGKCDTKKYGSQSTGGSSTVRSTYKNLLKLGATARMMLIDAAAAAWSVPVSECYAEEGHVIHRLTGKKIHYGELVEAASKLETPKEVTLKKTAEYKLIRKPLPRKDTPLKTNGTAVFGIDKVIPGMLYAVVERNHRLRGVVKNFDASAALQVTGVKSVFKVKMIVMNSTRDGIAVVADSLWAAMQGRKLLKVEWDDSGFEHVSTDEIYKRMRTALQQKDVLIAKTQGDPDPILAQLTTKLDVVYETPYQSHSCMEPLNCIAHHQGDKIEIWGPIQTPDWVQDLISAEMGIPKEKVTVNMTFLGGGLGRKAFEDFAHEAVQISKEMKAPVQVVWTREDDMTQGPFRPGVSYRCEGAVVNGEIAAVKFKMAGQNFNHWLGAKKDKANQYATEGFVKHYFDSISNISFSDVLFETPIPVMWWRSVYASTNGFAFESFFDELAFAAKIDPLEFRRKYLKEKRSQLLLDKIETVSGWKNRKPGQGYGIAITECFASTVVQVVKVSNVNNKIKIDKVWAAIDCGWYVNPDTIRAQVEGSIIMALGAATVHETHFKDGLAVEKNFHTYRMPRINEIPSIEIHIMDNDAEAGGVGEPGLPPFTPALTNAIFDLTGKRIRKLPFDLNKI